VAVANALQLEAARATPASPALRRHAKFEVANLSIAVEGVTSHQPFFSEN